MPIYLINAHADAEKAVPLEQKIRGLLPEIIKTKNLENITPEISSGNTELVHVIFFAPSNDATYVDLLVRTAENFRQRVFLILVSKEISGSNSKLSRRWCGWAWVYSISRSQVCLLSIIHITS